MELNEAIEKVKKIKCNHEESIAIQRVLKGLDEQYNKGYSKGFENSETWKDIDAGFDIELD